jgi:hypothetical protein
MSAGKRPRQPKGLSYLEGEEEPNSKHVRAPAIDTCYSFVEAVGPAFDSNRVLLRRLFFIREDKAKYVSVRYYPTKDYQPFMELGGAKKAPLILNEQHVRTMAEHLPRLCEAMCNDEHYSCKDSDFRMDTTGSYRVAQIYLGKQYAECKLHELRYLSYIFFMVRNQFTFYIAALNDVIAYVTSVQISTTYVEPAATAIKSVNYFQLFEELRAIV